MKLVDQWREIEADLPPGWDDVRLELTTEQPADLPRAAHLLSSVGVGKSGSRLVFHVQASGGAQSALAMSRQFKRLDDARVWCRLERTSVSESRRADVEDAVDGAEGATTAVASWDRALAPLPSDWTDLLCELELESSDDLDRAALLCAPMNPARDGARIAFTFRCSGRSGYGVSHSMARRCLQRIDAEGIAASTRIVRVLSDTDNVDTQGPVWLVGGKTL
jgi:hypothetical protein